MVNNTIISDIITEEDGRQICRVILPVDPSTISTAQQKKFDPRSRRFFTNSKVAKGKKIISLLARTCAAKVRSVISDTEPVELRMAFLYSYPKGTPKKNCIHLAPMPSGADCDNRAKAPIDALGEAGWWEDDRIITLAMLAKARTTQNPCIVILVSKAQKKDINSLYHL